MTMRVTVIPEDKWIRRNEVAVNLPEWNFNDSHIHAIQWYDTEGEIEFNTKPILPNEITTDISILQPYLDALDQYLIELAEIQSQIQEENV